MQAYRKGQIGYGAFSLIELLVVITVISILAGLLLPVLSKARSRATAIQCANNKSQLQLAWILYTHDHNDRVPPNGDVFVGPPKMDRQYWWAQGIMNYNSDHPDNTNVNLLIDPQYARLGNYTKSPTLYKCPNDQSSALIAGSRRPRVRSISMNVHVGRFIDCHGENPTQIGPRTVSAIPSPSMQFVFIDEHPDSIGTTLFWLSSAEGRYAKISSYPGALHDGGATLSFADGHVDSHRWVDARTKPPVKGVNDLSETDSPGNADIAWLQSRTYFPSGR